MELVILMLKSTLFAIGGLIALTHVLDALSKVQMSHSKKQKVMKLRKLMVFTAFVLTAILALLKKVLGVSDWETVIILVFIGVCLMELINNE